MSKEKILFVGGMNFLSRYVAKALKGKPFQLAFLDTQGYENIPDVKDLGQCFVGDLTSSYTVDSVVSSFCPTSLFINIPPFIDVDGVYKQPLNIKVLMSCLSLLTSVIQTFGIKKVYLASSYEVYGVYGSPQKLSEGKSEFPITDRGGILKATEEILRIFCLQNKTEFCSFRYSELYGLDYSLHPYNLVPQCLSIISLGGAVFVDNVEDKLDFIHALDAGKITSSLIEFSSTGPYNIGSGKGLRIKSVLNYIKRLSKDKNCIINSSTPSASFNSFVLDTRRLKKALPVFVINNWRQLIEADFDFYQRRDK